MGFILAVVPQRLPLPFDLSDLRDGWRCPKWGGGAGGPPPHALPGTIERQVHIKERPPQTQAARLGLKLMRSGAICDIASRMEPAHRHGMRWVSVAAAFVLLPWHQAVLSEPLPPTSKWVINFADDQCLAMRSFGSEKDPLHFALKSSPTSDVLQISLMRDGGRVAAIQQSGSLTFDSGNKVKVNQLRFSADRKVIRRINLDAADAQTLAHSSELGWSSPGHVDDLALGPMAPVMKVMTQCRDDLRRFWNIDPEKRAALKELSRSLTPLADAFSSDDYPWQAINNDETGDTGVVLLIDDKGELADCMVVETSNVATLDAMACFVIQERVKFAPAIGADGKPARSAFSQRIRWKIPNTPHR